MSDNNGPADISLLHQGRNRISLSVGRHVLSPTHIRSTVPRPVHEQEYASAFQLFAKGKHRIIKARAGTVNEDDRRQILLAFGFDENAV